MTELKFEDMTAAASGDRQNMLGKLLYFSLPSVLVDKNDLRQLCVDMNIPYAGGNRLSVSDAFRSATGDVRDRIISEEYGERRIYQIYCRDNRRISDSVISRELVKETMHQETNQYEKLANISYDKDSQIFSYDNLAYDSQIDAMAYCRRAEELFELYQRCANRRQVETICVNFLRILESTKLSVNGHLYFVPRHNMEKVDIFEDFVAELSQLSRNQTHLMANSIYTSRGCPRKCPFCAVKTLEPTFYECQNVREQIERVDEKFGSKKNLLIMDNNILFAPHLAKTIDTLVLLGFGAENNHAKKSNEMAIMLRSLSARKAIGKSYEHLLKRIKNKFLSINEKRINKDDSRKLQEISQTIIDDERFVTTLHDEYEFICDFFGRYDYHKITRYVDFNQGLDARFFTAEKACLLAKGALKPCRIAFDDIRTKKEYFHAMELADQSGIRHFSNYILYNYTDAPEDLWNRLFMNVDFCERHKEIKSLFSFPMKYASIEYTDRSYIGELWNKKYLRSINVILNVTSGVVAKEKDFFFRAFGQDTEEYLEILSMPDDFIRYRDYFEKNGLIERWKEEYRRLTIEQQTELIELLSEVKSEVHVEEEPHTITLDPILAFYGVNKRRMEKNEAYYLRLLGAN